MKYPFSEIEAKWQKYWEEKKVYETNLSDTEKKLYHLNMFIYPSGSKLHTGHWYHYGPSDSWARYKKLRGFNVFEPMGYDAFGLPAENYAIKTGIHPYDSTMQNIKDIRVQLKKMGCMYDWNAELMTCVPEYYKWNQWLFLQLYKKGLAYRKNAPVNWCPNDQTVLANEQVQADGTCERCGTLVIQKNLTQWFFKITQYAEELLADLEKINWPEKTKLMQKNWIGKSTGAEVKFKVVDSKEEITVFTTRPDTLFGVTYVVIAPEHPLVQELTTPDSQESVNQYIDSIKSLTEIERTSTVKEKTGVPIGTQAINPVNGEKVPIWIADYALVSYGTGCVMAVPGHDERDFEFAKKFNLPIRAVIEPSNEWLIQNARIQFTEDVKNLFEKFFDASEVRSIASNDIYKFINEGYWKLENVIPFLKNRYMLGDNLAEDFKSAYTDPGTMINSGKYDGKSASGGLEIIDDLEKEGTGRKKINYRLRDWLISRQRYWGTPIPIIYCPKCGEVPVDEKELPVELPYEVEFKPTGESPLTTNKEFLNVKCPKCGENAKRDVDTMDTFVDSSWYYFRYLDPHFEKGIFDTNKTDNWVPVDMYVGGAEHATMHLLYARFIHKFLRDIGLTKSGEPFSTLIHQGTITNAGAKMSKSRGNVVNPDNFTKTLGSDVFRLYLMFMGPYELGGDWSDKGITGTERFVQRTYELFNNYKDIVAKTDSAQTYVIEKLLDEDKKIYRKVNQTIKKFGNEINEFRFNTAIAALMELLNELKTLDECSDRIKAYSLERFAVLLAPLAPHLAEECWQIIGHKNSIFEKPVWFEHDEKALTEETVNIAVQVNGKLRAAIQVTADSDKDEVKSIVMENEKVANHLNGKKIIKEIFVKNKIYNIVAK